MRLTAGDGWIVPFSKGVYLSGGRFAGVVVVGLRPQALVAAFPLRLAAGGAIRVFDDGGAVLATVPSREHTNVSARLPAGKKNAGHRRTTADGLHSVAWRRVAGLPLVVAAFLPLGPMLRQWARLLLALSGLAVCLSAALSLLGHRIQRQARLLEDLVGRRTADLRAARDEAVRARQSQTLFVAGASPKGR